MCTCFSLLTRRVIQLARSDLQATFDQMNPPCCHTFLLPSKANLVQSGVITVCLYDKLCL